MPFWSGTLDIMEDMCVRIKQRCRAQAVPGLCSVCYRVFGGYSQACSEVLQESEINYNNNDNNNCIQRRYSRFFTISSQRHKLSPTRTFAFKGAIRDFLQSPHSAANCLQHTRSSGPGAIVCKSHATHRVLIKCKCHVRCFLVRRDSSAIKFDRV